MRSTCEIIADLKDGLEVSCEELKMACLVQSAIIFFFRQDVKALLGEGIAKDLKIQMEYSDPETSSKEMGTPSWYWKAIKADPEKWLSPRDIPNTPEWEKMHRIHQKILDKVMKEN